jgi:hypothetical protein
MTSTWPPAEDRNPGLLCWGVDLLEELRPTAVPSKTFAAPCQPIPHASLEYYSSEAFDHHHIGAMTNIISRGPISSSAQSDSTKGLIPLPVMKLASKSYKTRLKRLPVISRERFRKTRTSYFKNKLFWYLKYQSAKWYLKY